MHAATSKSIQIPCPHCKCVGMVVHHTFYLDDDGPTVSASCAACGAELDPDTFQYLGHNDD